MIRRPTLRDWWHSAARAYYGRPDPPPGSAREYARAIVGGVIAFAIAYVLIVLWIVWAAPMP